MGVSVAVRWSRTTASGWIFSEPIMTGFAAFAGAVSTALDAGSTTSAIAAVSSVRHCHSCSNCSCAMIGGVSPGDGFVGRGVLGGIVGRGVAPPEDPSDDPLEPEEVVEKDDHPPRPAGSNQFEGAV